MLNSLAGIQELIQEIKAICFKLEHYGCLNFKLLHLTIKKCALEVEKDLKWELKNLRNQLDNWM